MYAYAPKRVLRSWPLFTAFFLGLTLAATLFTGTLLGADAIGFQMLREALASVPVDVTATRYAQNVSFTAVDDARGQLRNVTHVARVETLYRLSGEMSALDHNATSAFIVAAIENGSVLYEDAGFVNASDHIGGGHALIEDGSMDAGTLAPGDTVTLRLEVRSDTPPFDAHVFAYNLTVVGTVGLSEKAFGVAAALTLSRAQSYLRQLLLGGQPRRPAYNLVVISNQTLRAILDAIDDQDQLPGQYIASSLLIWLDRDAIVNPWDVDQSRADGTRVTAQIANRIRPTGYTPVNLLNVVLSAIEQLTRVLKIGFIVLSLPVVFTAWYMGMTVSDVSLNLRRREIGLLFTKGFSKRQVLGIFFSESLLLGVIAAASGILCGVLLLPLVNLAGVVEGFAFLSVESVALAVAFSVVVAVLAVFQPARRATDMTTMAALREYAPEDGVPTTRRRWPTVALILGLYKLLAYVVGFNLQAYPLPGRGWFVYLLFGIGVFVDQILGYLAPILFFWGFSKLFIEGSSRLQAALGRLSRRVIGDLSEIATRNAQRTLARTAAVAFLVALIVGYGVSVVGGLASADDFVERSIYANVGADVSIWMFSPENATLVLEAVAARSDVAAATVEHWRSVDTSFGVIQVRAIDPDAWRDVAYYEDGWITGASATDALSSLAADNETIILDKAIGESYGLTVGQNVSVTLGAQTQLLRVVALFGPEDAAQLRATAVQPPTVWSYIPQGLHHQTGEAEVTQTRVLVQLEPGVNGSRVAGELRHVDANVEQVNAVETLKQSVGDNVFLDGQRRVQALGVPFALLTSSVGVTLIVVTALRERRKAITLMAIKGFSVWQIVQTQLLEHVSLVGFSILLGTFVGYVTTIGTIQAFRVQPSLVTRRVVFPLEYSAVVVAMAGVVLASVIVPLVVMVRRYATRLEWRIKG